MKKVYAKNPAEIVLDNPAKKSSYKKKDPRRVAAGKKAWKTRQQKSKKTMSRKNPSDYAKTGKQMFAKYGLAAVGTIIAVKGTSFLLNRFGTSLPAAARKYAPIAVPAIGGVVLATKAKQKNEIAQGIAGGMVFSAVSNALNHVMPVAEQAAEGLSDAIGFKNNSFLGNVSKSSLVVSEDGTVYDMNGNPQGIAQAALPSGKPKKATAKAGTPAIVDAVDYEAGELY